MTSCLTARRTFAAWLLLSALPALANSSDIPLGKIPRFQDERAARAACGDDPVVWADGKSGFFYPKFHPDYGRTAHGAYTCYRQAKKADYWSLVPEGDGGREGREFPSFFCTQCS